MANLAIHTVSRNVFAPTWAPWAPEAGAERRCWQALRLAGELAALGPEAVPAAREAISVAMGALLVWSDDVFFQSDDQCSPAIAALRQAQDDLAQAEACLRRLERGPGLAKAHPATASAAEVFG